MKERILEKSPLGEAICARLRAEMAQLGFSAVPSIGVPDYQHAAFSCARDPYSGEEALIATWCDQNGRTRGTLKFHGDGTFYAEYDIARPHPTDARWFVESVMAWGKGELIKAEAKLLPALRP